MAAKGHPWLFLRFFVLSDRMVRRPLEFLQRPMRSGNSFCISNSCSIDRFVSLGVYALFISLPCFLHIREERRKGDFFQRLQRVGDFTGFQILPTSKKDIDRSFRRELLYKLPPFNFQFEPRWMFLFNLRHLLTTLLELLARSCAAACPRRHRECGAPHGGGDLTR